MAKATEIRCRSRGPHSRAACSILNRLAAPLPPNWRKMPKYYFDIREKGRFVPDEERTDLPDMDAAEREAAELAASIGRDRLPSSESRAIIVEARNEHRQRVMTVTASLDIVRVRPRPRGPPRRRPRPKAR